LPPQDEVSSSSSSPHAPISCDELSPFVLSNATCHEDQSKNAFEKKIKIMRNLKFSNSLNHSLAMGGICGG
jgi:hypothetical protein